MSDPLVIVGGGPAGLSCARSFRERGGAGAVLIVGDDPHPPYERPALSKEFLRREIERDELPLEEPAFFVQHSIELRTDTRVAALDADRRVLTTQQGDEIPYSACVLACGSRPAQPDVTGIHSKGVVILRSQEQSAELRERVRAGTRVLVVGSGFIGCEAAISLAANGAEVTLATNESHPQEQRLGGQVAERIERWLAESGVELITDVELGAIEPGVPLRVELGERRVEADTVLTALGVVRNTEIAAAAGIELSEDLIPTDERMRTSREGVFAIGDVALAWNATAGRRLRVEHWGEAFRHGEVAGAVLAGDDEERWANAPGFWSGLGERTIKQVAWGDGFDRVDFTEHGNEAFTVRYVGGGELVGVLTHDADDDYERGREAVEARTPWPS